MPAPVDYDALVGRRRVSATAAAGAPQMAATPAGAASSGAGNADGGVAAMRDWHNSPSVWFIVLALGAAYLARAAGFIRGR